jgi:hypothetical protein
MTPVIRALPSSINTSTRVVRTSWRQGRQRRAKPSNIEPGSGSVSVEPYSSTAVLPGCGSRDWRRWPQAGTRTIRATTYAAIFARFTSCPRDLGEAIEINVDEDFAVQTQLHRRAQHRVVKRRRAGDQKIGPDLRFHTPSHAGFCHVDLLSRYLLDSSTVVSQDGPLEEWRGRSRTVAIANGSPTTPRSCYQ